MKFRTLTLSLAVAGLLTAPAVAAPKLLISEIYTGITGEDGTPDWIEITNFGDTDGDTGILWYDDESLDVLDGVQLPSATLAPGESAVFIVTDDVDANSISEFTAIWGAIPNLYTAAGGGGLSQNGDTAAILLADNTVVDLVAFPGLPSTNTATIEPLPYLASQPFAGLGVSVAGERGAYASNPFFNDNLQEAIDNGNMLSLVGSPGVYVGIPEPSTAALLIAGACGMIGARRRK